MDEMIKLREQPEEVAEVEHWSRVSQTMVFYWVYEVYVYTDQMAVSLATDFFLVSSCYLEPNSDISRGILHLPQGSTRYLGEVESEIPIFMVTQWQTRVMHSLVCKPSFTHHPRKDRTPNAKTYLKPPASHFMSIIQ